METYLLLLLAFIVRVR